MNGYTDIEIATAVVETIFILWFAVIVLWPRKPTNGEDQ